MPWLIGLRYFVLSTGVLLGKVQESHLFFHCSLGCKLPFCRRARADLKECCSGKLRNLQCGTGVEVTRGGVQHAGLRLSDLMARFCVYVAWWIYVAMHLELWFAAFICYSLPSFSLEHLLAWLIYQLYYSLGIGLRLCRIGFVDLAFFLPCIFSLFSPC